MFQLARRRDLDAFGNQMLRKRRKSVVFVCPIWTMAKDALLNFVDNNYARLREVNIISRCTYRRRHDRTDIKEGWYAVSSINRFSTALQASHLLNNLQHEVHRSCRFARSGQRSSGETFGHGVDRTGEDGIVSSGR